MYLACNMGRHTMNCGTPIPVHPPVKQYLTTMAGCRMVSRIGHWLFFWDKRWRDGKRFWHFSSQPFRIQRWSVDQKVEPWMLITAAVLHSYHRSYCRSHSSIFLTLFAQLAIELQRKYGDLATNPSFIQDYLG